MASINLIPGEGGNIELPSGYQLLEEWLNGHPGQMPDHDSVRWISSGHDEPLSDEEGNHFFMPFMRSRIQFVLNPENEQLKSFQAECVRDSKLLAQALERAFASRKLPLISQGTSKSAWQRISILIRPPFLNSDIEKTHQNRANAAENDLLFYIHVDTHKTFHLVRFHRTFGQWKEIQYELNKFFYEWFKNRTHYGKWDDLADAIAQLLEEKMKLDLNHDISDFGVLSDYFEFPGVMPAKEAIKRFICSQLAMVDPSAIPHLQGVYVPMIMELIGRFASGITEDQVRSYFRAGEDAFYARKKADRLSQKSFLHPSQGDHGEPYSEGKVA